MPTLTGGVDEGGFYFLEEFDTNNPIDMEQLRDLLRDPDLYDVVESYEEKCVTVKVRPTSGAFGDDW
jgi:hypothetical protein